MLMLLIKIMENPYAKMLRLVILSPLGIIGVSFLFLGAAGIFLYGILIAYKPSLVYQWQSWMYPLIFLFLAFVFIDFSLTSEKRSTREFIRAVRNAEKKMSEGIIKKNISNSTSEFGPNSRDIEILKMVKDSGGYVPILRQQIIDSPFDIQEGIESIAKLSLLEYLRIPEGKGMKIIITSKGLDAMELPPITFASLVPWDISLMLIRANLLYSEGNYEKTILEIYNLLERALKVHLIPTIENYREKWNEKIENKVGNDAKAREMYSWKGEKTIASLNALWNFYKKNSELGKKWKSLMDAEVDEVERMKKTMDRIVDVIADTRSRYAHNKPGGKYKKDAYRIIKLAEILIGVLFENMKEKSLEN